MDGATISHRISWVRTAPILRRNLRKLIAKLVGMLWPPNSLVVVRNATDVLRRGPSRQSPNGLTGEQLTESAEQALGWLGWSQDAVRTGGVASYDFCGWSPGYPEVTGYIIPTIWDYARHTGRADLPERALRMAEWLLHIQTADGGWEGGHEGEGLPPLVFNSGQVMRGLLRTYQETHDTRYLASARRAGDWILSVQDPDGSWTSANHLRMKRVYDTYVAAPLATLSMLDGSTKYADAAKRNCEFALSRQRANGWFELCDNTPDFTDAPITHAICYTVDGLIETGSILSEEAYITAGVRTANAMAAQAEPTGYLPGRFDEEWRPRVRWVCLTGSAQLGVILLKLYSSTPDPRYTKISERLVGFLRHTQRLNSVGRNRSGSIAGSYPVWGSYAPFRFPCWATKYYLDLLLLMAQTKSLVPVVKVE